MLVLKGARSLDEGVERPRSRKEARPYRCGYAGQHRRVIGAWLEGHACGRLLPEPFVAPGFWPRRSHIPRTYDHANHMVSASERELSEAGVTGRPEVGLADAGYWSNDHIGALRARGMIPIVAPDTTHSRPRKTRPAGP